MTEKKNEKVMFVQAATPEEFFAQIKKAHMDVYEKEKEKEKPQDSDRS